MKIYFAGSIRGGSQDAAIYKQLIAYLKVYGSVLTEHVGDAERTMQKTYSDKQIWDQDMDWLRQSDCVVAEVTVTSLGVGYELGIAESLNIPVLCLFRKEATDLSAMVTGNQKFLPIGYYQELNQAYSLISQFMDERVKVAANGTGKY